MKTNSYDRLETSEKIKLLRLYFTTQETIIKHKDKTWAELPFGFRAYILVLKDQVFREFVEELP